MSVPEDLQPHVVEPQSGTATQSHPSHAGQSPRPQSQTAQPYGADARPDVYGRSLQSCQPRNTPSSHPEPLALLHYRHHAINWICIIHVPIARDRRTTHHHPHAALVDAATVPCRAATSGAHAQWYAGGGDAALRDVVAGGKV